LIYWLVEVFTLKRLAAYLLVLLLIAVILFTGWREYRALSNKISNHIAGIDKYNSLSSQAEQYALLDQKLKDAESKYQALQIDFKDIKTLLSDTKVLLINEDSVGASQKITDITNLLDKKIAEAEALLIEEGKKGELSGRIMSAGSAIKQADINLTQDNKDVETVKSDDSGNYTFSKHYAGNYVLKVELSGYKNYSGSVTIKAGEKTEFEIKLEKIPTETKAPVRIQQGSTSASTSNASTIDDGIYHKTKVTTDKGEFTVHYLDVDLSSYQMIVDTAADGDCENDCPVKSLASYVNDNGAVGGIHGTYFCPTSYSSCAGKTNSFYYKLYNTRLDKQINWSNGLGNYLPFLRIDRSGSPSYFDSWWEARNLEMSAGISCRPRLVSDAKVVVTEADLDSDKEKVERSGRGFVGLRGNNVIAGVVINATIIESASAVQALGLDYAMNLDAGGTTAFYYNGSYKVGPGRDMPNAIVFKRR